MTRVSVVIPCFNVAEQLKRSVSSVQRQTMADWEAILVDDASGDDTVDVARSLCAGDPRLRLIDLPANGGPGVARNAGIDAARGEWIAVLDADDAFHPERLETLVRLGEEREAEIVFDNLMLFDDRHGVETGPALAVEGPEQWIDLARFVEKEGPASDLKLGLLKMIARRDRLLARGLRYSPGYRFSEDTDLYVRALLEGARCLYSPRPLYLYTTRFGRESRARSRGSRTVLDPALRVAIADRLIADYDGRVSADQMTLLHRFRRWQALYADVHEMAERRRRWDLAGILAVIRRNPAALRHYAATSRIGRRIAGKGR